MAICFPAESGTKLTAYQNASAALGARIKAQTRPLPQAYLNRVMTHSTTVQQRMAVIKDGCDAYTVLVGALVEIEALGAEFAAITGEPDPVKKHVEQTKSDFTLMGFLTKWGLWILLGYGAYRLVRKWTADEIPSHELPRYAGGTRRFRLGTKGFSYTSSR